MEHSGGVDAVSQDCGRVVRNELAFTIALREVEGALIHRAVRLPDAARMRSAGASSRAEIGKCRGDQYGDQQQ